ncbi:MAG TPA: CDP-alcohol phosphatidyltransferase family protein [Aliidongia sp.]|nr:CDP-alcohol phosphatidyltransferase family protein [Aliidongia sp.]
MTTSLACLTLVGAGVLGAFPPASLGVALAGCIGWAAYAVVAGRAALKAPLPRFGWANRVTLLRGLVVALMIAFLPTPDRQSWLAPMLGATALVLDGVDGAVARRTGTASPFGARFDMETDALTVLVLSAAVAARGQVGAWVLLSGALRYLYVGAGWVWPWLRRPVPPSFARRLVCVLQIAGLLAALSPLLAPPWPSAVAGLSLGLLLWSFGRDVLWLVRERGMAESPDAPYLNGAGSV